MTSNRLAWQHLLPNHTPYQTLFAQAAQLSPAEFSVIQPRLADSLTLFCHPRSPSRFMLLKALEDSEYMALIERAVNAIKPQANALFGSKYTVEGAVVRVQPATQSTDNFASQDTCRYQEWIEPEQLFGSVRHFQGEVTLTPGLIHKVNGGTLILTARTLLAQPLMWLRLKQTITEGVYRWLSPNERKPLPIDIPPMPLDIRLIILGDRESLGDIHDIEPDLSERSVYGEFEAQLQLIETEDMSRWCAYINALCQENHLPRLAADAWPELFKQAVRYSGDQGCLPLCPLWLTQQLKYAALYAQSQEVTAQTLIDASAARRWREGYLRERMQDEIELGQILIETDGYVIGQVNGLSVLEYPGYPITFGEPTRISCVVHPGDGEFTDVERKAELGGNLHAKGMMIMQAFLISELELDQQLPFSASIVFEQSYGEVDGDSASLAELSALISALALQPINQQIAVTGSVDQFGHVQPIGGVNEKIEGFFEVCQRRGLTGQQGVVLPAANLRHLCLHEEVIAAVREGQFHLFPVETAPEAISLLTNLAYNDAHQPNLLAAIRERIGQLIPQERRRFPWFFR
ncbi:MULTISPECIES: Lon protease family protein [unclassified Brenneria]|uniref:Lon protease family protein n=1 Tax=unclassified Brenneria TaxID=2634434 RepID=UPI0029C48D94|nr:MULTISPECIES: Lon protease family protein [unclassified Brenneria]MDX5627325.1 Lon protease family protein [Brenneria sp. L3-3Z]MDX5694519.1 Lon protease family protein [Brenneria sp. L4-2C]MEE3661857.1 Lon protease family protein [Brenneria sp. g21c3]